MSNSTEHPRVFISYSWSSPQHEEFVLDLATNLRTNGVDVILDKWHLQAGQDKFAFMESMVTDSTVTNVLVLSDKRYTEKANARAGGVGTESQIISEKVYARTDQTKFIPVVCEFDEAGSPYLPAFMKARIYVDISSGDKFGDGVEKLLRLIYEQPEHKMPALGAPPSFLSANAPGVVLAREQPAAVRAIQEGKANRSGLETLFVRSLLSRVDELYVTPDGKDYDEGVYQAIQKTKGLRDQWAEYVDTVASFSDDDPRAATHILWLLENLANRFNFAGTGNHYPGWQDLYKFFALEAVLVTVASFLRHYRWSVLRKILNHRYVVEGRSAESRVLTVDAFEPGDLVSIDGDRKRRLQLNRLSVSADLLRERCTSNITSLTELIQADVFLALDAAVNLQARTKPNGYLAIWGPRTTIFRERSGPLEVFLRAHNDDIRAGLRLAMGITSSADFRAKYEHAHKELQGFRPLTLDPWGRSNIIEAINLEVLLK